jgi:hypothetical protein
MSLPSTVLAERVDHTRGLEGASLASAVHASTAGEPPLSLDREGAGERLGQVERTEAEGERRLEPAPRLCRGRAARLRRGPPRGQLRDAARPDPLDPTHLPVPEGQASQGCIDQSGPGSRPTPSASATRLM